MLYPI